MKKYAAKGYKKQTQTNPISNPATAFLRKSARGRLKAEYLGLLITQEITAVDSEKKIIVACDLTNQSNDKQQFEPMQEQSQEEPDC
jgi:hypothetical protein